MIGSNSFGGNALGLGVVLYLQDAFSQNAKLIQNQMRLLGVAGSNMRRQFQNGMNGVQQGLGLMTVGAVGLAAFAPATAAAMSYQKEVAYIKTLTKGVKEVTDEWINDKTLNMSKQFLAGPIEQAKTLGALMAANIPVLKAPELLAAANRLAVATGSDLETTTRGMISTLHAFNIGLSDDVPIETFRKRVKQLTDQLQTTIQIGAFGDGGESDLEAMSKQIGQFAPMIQAQGISVSEMLGVWATSTLGGQNARKSATGIRQAITDILKPTKRANTFYKDMLGIEKEDAATWVRNNGIVAFLDKVRSYTRLDSTQALKLFDNEQMKRQLADLGKLDGNTKIADSKEAQKFLKTMQDLGGINIGKAADVFKSIYGLTAMLPLLTVQYKNLKINIDKVRNSEGATKAAFDLMMETASAQTKLFQSNFQRLLIIIGTHLLPIVTATLKVLTSIIRTVGDLAQKFPLLTKFIIISTVAFFSFISAVGILRAAMGILAMRTASVQFLMARFPIYARIVAFWSQFTLMRMMTFMLLAGVAIILFKRIWDSNFLGIRDTLVGVWNTVSTIFEAISQLWKNYDSKTGKSSISGPIVATLQQMGLIDLVGNIFAVTVRIKSFFDGIGEGISKLFKDAKLVVEEFLTATYGPVKEILKNLGVSPSVIASFDKFVKSLMSPTKQNIQDWKEIGKTIGYFGGIAVALFVIAPVVLTLIRVFSFLWGVLRFVFTIGRAFLTFGGLITSFLAFLVVALGAVIIFAAAVLTNVGGIKDKIVDWFTNELVNNNPIVTWFADTAYKIQQFFIGIGDWFYNVGLSMATGITNAIINIVQTFNRIKKAGSDMLAGFIFNFVSGIKRIVKLFTDLPGAISSQMGAVGTFLQGMFTGILNGIINLLNKGIEGFNNLSPFDLPLIPTISGTSSKPSNPNKPETAQVISRTNAQASQLMLMAQGADTEGGVTITPNEMATILADLKETIAQSNASDKVTVVQVDGKVIAKAVTSAGQADRRLGGKG